MADRAAGLYISFYPYAQNFQDYMTAPGEIYDLEPLWCNVIPNVVGMSGQTAFSVVNPFRPCLWYALAGLIVVVPAVIRYRCRAK